MLRPPASTLFPYTTLFRSVVEPDERPGHDDRHDQDELGRGEHRDHQQVGRHQGQVHVKGAGRAEPGLDRKSTRLNSSHSSISYAVVILNKKNAKFLSLRIT